MASLSRLEVAYGRFDSGDIGEYRSLFKNLVSSMAGLEYFFSRIQERKDVLTNKVTPLRTRTGTVGSIAPEHPTKLYEALHKKYRPVGEFETQRRMQILENVESDTNQALSMGELDKLLDLVNNRFSNTLLSADRAIDALIEWLKTANEFRIYSLIVPGRYKKHREAQAKQHELLRAAHQDLLNELNHLEESRWEEIFHAEDEVGPLVAAFIAQGALFGFSVKRYCIVLTRILDTCEYLDKNRPLPELILPFKKTSRARVRFDRRLISADQDATNPDDFPGFRAYDSTEARDPDASPARNVGHLIGRRVVKIYSVIFKDNFLFALRTAIIGVVATIPAFVRSTALFYYGNRLIWVVIMTCISTSDVPGDVIKAYIQKLLYTFLACVFGMVAWYISTGSGNGNPYGFAVVNIFVVYILVCYRHFSKHTLPTAAIVLGASTELVLGTSWQNAQIPTPGTHGTGFRIAWIRFVTVSIGVTLGFLASCFPKPRTGKFAVRNILARVLRTIGNIHCDIGKFGVQRIRDPNVHKLVRNDVVTDRISSVLVKLSSVFPLMKTLKYEPELTGPWPRDKYLRLIRLNTDIVQLAFGLYIVLDELRDPERWVHVVASRCGWTSTEMMTSFFAIIHMASLSLATGGPLPRVSPAQLTLKHLKLLEDNWNISVDSMVRKIIQELNELRAGADIDENQRKGSGSGSGDGGEEDSDEMKTYNTEFGNLLSHDGQLCIVALLFARMIYERLDELLIVVKGLVGEEFDYNPEFATDLDDAYETTKLLI